MIQRLAEIRREEGPLYFDRYMDSILYDPRRGYYRQGKSPIGAQGDFVTLPETTPLFAETLARVLAPCFAAGLKRTLIEVGPGSGRLAEGLVRALGQIGMELEHYVLVEPDRGLWPAQQALLTSCLPDRALPFVWSESPPTDWSGMLVMNEIVDAWPVALVEKSESGWVEWGVDICAGCPTLEKLPLRASVGACISRIEAQVGPLPVCYRTECNPALEAQLGRILAGCGDGVALIIDYGHSRRHYYHPERSMGTLQCYLHQLVHDDPLYAPGVQDVTAMVDFTALAEAGERLGWALSGYAPLAPFLLAAGLLETARPGLPDPAGRVDEVPRSREILRLTEPHESGELFKVMMLEKGDVPDVAVFADSDQSDRL